MLELQLRHLRGKGCQEERGGRRENDREGGGGSWSDSTSFSFWRRCTSLGWDNQGGSRAGVRDIFLTKSHSSSRQVLTESQNKKSTGSTETSSKVDKEDSEARGLQREGVRASACRRGTLKRGLKYTGERSLIGVFFIK